MLVVPELEQEVELLCRSREMRKVLRKYFSSGTSEYIHESIQ